jgi:ATP adenylyltransferase
VLEQDDLEATYACLKAWQDAADSKQKRLFAFFNSGEHSGASQPHRHLQLLPVENMREGDQTSGWELLIDMILSREGGQRDQPSGLLQHPDIPFTHFACRFDSEPSGSTLLRMYKELYNAASKAVDRFVAKDPAQLALHPTEAGDLSISYNLAMTTSGMVVMPRRAEGAMLRHEDGTDIGFVALNGTTLGGTMMVKRQEEWDALRKRPEMLGDVLAAIGISREPLMEKSHV